MTFKYGLNSVLKSMEFDGDWLVEGIERVKMIFPSSTEKMLTEMQNQKQDSKWIFAELTEVSFEAFYKDTQKRSEEKKIHKRHGINYQRRTKWKQSFLFQN
ncbi:hypothetical protein OK18_19195 [Chryseobacterium gallinarum]|uniref:Uncharacterized protein n=1 Tax=Chryseobacterium gallinarum TaxID=1324352 RepID=A0A0G3M8Z4_CHRGL|nr:hypothetical protein [Chryseobacterium gallinarum]AKK74458.1 hypothetical protein OK18_19195 [Chryseobacterium gallinarum]